MLSRHLAGPLRAALAESRVVLLNGARQVGKTTLAMEIAGESDPPRRPVEPRAGEPRGTARTS